MTFAARNKAPLHHCDLSHFLFSTMDSNKDFEDTPLSPWTASNSVALTNDITTVIVRKISYRSLGKYDYPTSFREPNNFLRLALTNSQWITHAWSVQQSVLSLDLLLDEIDPGLRVRGSNYGPPSPSIVAIAKRMTNLKSLGSDRVGENSLPLFLTSNLRELECRITCGSAFPSPMDFLTKLPPLPNLARFDLRVGTKCVVPDDFAQSVNLVAPSLTAYHFSGAWNCQSPQTFFDHLTCLSKLSSLAVGSVAVDGASFSHLTKLTTLALLSLSNACKTVCKQLVTYGIEGLNAAMAKIAPPTLPCHCLISISRRKSPAGARYCDNVLSYLIRSFAIGLSPSNVNERIFALDLLVSNGYDVDWTYRKTQIPFLSALFGPDVLQRMNEKDVIKIIKYYLTKTKLNFARFASTKSYFTSMVLTIIGTIGSLLTPKQ